MPRMDINRMAELEVFIRVVETESFSAAARSLELTPSAISKLISRLEKRLETRLFNRSTRQIKVTVEGCAFYERGKRILADLEEAERCASRDSIPRGNVSISCNIAFGQHILLPLIPMFNQAYPEISLDINLTDETVDIIERRADIAIRSGPLKNSGLIARKLASTRMVIVGAPSYIERHGIPETPEDLDKFHLIDFNFIRHTRGWPVLKNGEVAHIPIEANTKMSDGESIRTLVLSGAGFARLALFQVAEDIKAGRLIEVLADYNPQDIEDIHALFTAQRSIMPSRVSVLLDFLIDTVKIK